MDLITVNAEPIIANVVECDSFHGDKGRASTIIDSNIMPKILPCRKIIPAEIKQIEKNTHICQQTQPSNTPNTLLLHSKGLSSFEKVDVDIFEYDRKHYLITIDYFSKFVEIDAFAVTYC